MLNKYMKQEIRFVFSFYFLLSVILSSTNMIRAAPSIIAPLWTPEDILKSPTVNIRDISSDGKYTIIQVNYAKLTKTGDFNNSTQCLLVNNETLEKTIVGEEGISCKKSSFIGTGENFTYLNYDRKTKQWSLFVENVLSHKKTKVQELPNEGQGYSFAPDGKSFVFFVVDQKVKPSIQVIEGDQEGGTQRLYLQKVDEDFLPVGNPQLLLSDLTMADSDDGSPYIWSPNSQKMALLTKKKSTWKLPYPLLLSVLDVSKGTLEKIDEGRNIAANLIFSPDSQKIVFIKVGDCGKEESPVIPLKDVVGLANIEVVDLKTKERTVLPGKDFWEINGWAQGGQALVGLKQIGTKRKICEVDLSSKAITVKETPTLSIVHGAVFSHNQKYMAFLGETLFDPKEVYVANLEDLVPKKITSLSEKIDLHQIQAKPIKWTSSDRVEVEGILVYPQNYTVGHKAPLIVFIHGGPSGTALEQFIGDVWFGAYSPAVFSSVGYATLAVNYRGSSGYGTKFSTLDYQDLGGGDFQDIMAGVNFLIKEGIVDPEQLFITGHSYGGFMVSWAVGHTDRFKAAVMSAGISDWISDIALTDAPKLMESYFGSFYWDNYALYQNASPLSYVNNIKTPTLILHGAFDERVDKTQAMQLYHALNGRKVPTQLFLYSSGHGFDAIDSIDAMKEQIRWFDKYRKSPTNSGSELHL